MVAGLGAVTNWGQTINVNVTTDTNFSVWTAAIGGTETTTPATLNLNDPPDPTVINYYIQNDGNVQIRITGSLVVNVGSVTAVWNPVSGYVDIPVGTTRLQLTLTLSDFSVGTSEYVVSFVSSETP
jgi:hypothetical protein